MRFWGFVKGKDDFGRMPIGNGDICKYEMIGAEAEPGDLMVYIYPKTGTALTYIVTEKGDAPWNKPDDMPIGEGKMTVYKKRDQITGLHQWLADNEKKYPSLYKRIITFCEEALK